MYKYSKQPYFVKYMYTPADYNLSHLSYFEALRGLNGCNILWTLLPVISLRQRALFKDLEKN